MANKQIKNKKRVKERGEVFTNEREVKAMCDLIPKEIWEDITKTYLEPSCGTGNFLVEIYARKLNYCSDDVRTGLKALNSIYGIDIMQDNVEESRQRLFNMFVEKYPQSNNYAKMFAKNILKRNIICGDSLKIMKNLETLKWEDSTLS